MHIAVSQNILGRTIGAVAFDFDQVLEPHEHLQREMLIFTGPYDSATRFAEWAGRNIGKRAFVWTRTPGDVVLFNNVLQNNGALLQHWPWNERQYASISTMAWAAQHVLGSEFHVPSVQQAGLQVDVPLHDAAMSATLVQAALRALVLHERRWGLGKAGHPKTVISS